MYICNVHNWQLQQRVLTGLPYSGWQKRHFNNYSKRERKTYVCACVCVLKRVGERDSGIVKNEIDKAKLEKGSIHITKQIFIIEFTIRYVNQSCNSP